MDSWTAQVMEDLTKPLEDLNLDDQARRRARRQVTLWYQHQSEKVFEEYQMQQKMAVEQALSKLADIDKLGPTTGQQTAELMHPLLGGKVQQAQKRARLEPERQERDIRELDAISIELRLQSLPECNTLPVQVEQSRQPERYPAKTHARKVRDELGVEKGLVYLVGQKEKTWEDTDGDMPFRQRRFEFYLSGANFPGTAVTYDIAKDYLILWVPVRLPAKELWYGAVPSIKECERNYDVDSVQDIKKMPDYLKEVTDPSKDSLTVYVLHEKERPLSPFSFELDDKLLIKAMSRARAVKTPYEISQIRKAVDISSEAHSEVMKHIKHLTNEAEVESIFLSKCRELGAKLQAYPPIAGSGPNASILHYGANDQDFENRQLLVLDAGAEFECYASDVTRTFPLNGEFSEEAKKIYQIVLNMQNECISMIKPGRSWIDVGLKAVDVAAQGLLNIGILHEVNGKRPGYDVIRTFFPHGLGHLVGLDTHDVIANAGIRGSATATLAAIFGGKRCRLALGSVEGVRDQSAAGLKEGMVITCEPGLYFNRAYIEDRLQDSQVAKFVDKTLLEKYYPVGGCRLEDCILVTKDGYENMTTAPKGYEMMKVINGEA